MSDMMTGADSNYDEICGVLEDRLTPVFELLGERLKGLEEQNSELKDIVFKIVSGFGDAVNEHKKGGYSEMLSSKYGSDLESIGGPYKELYDKDITQELLDKLMGGELSEDGIPEYVGGIKSKFDKLRSPAADGSVVSREEPQAPAEEAKPEEAKAEEAPEEEPRDQASIMAKGLGLKMNSPKVPKFGK